MIAMGSRGEEEEEREERRRRKDGEERYKYNKEVVQVEVDSNREP